MFYSSRHAPHRLTLALLIALAATLTTLMRTPWVGVVNLDGAIFTLLGQALASGQGYVLLSEPTPQPYFTFPPLWPMQIALIAKLLGALGVTSDGALQLATKGWMHALFCASIPLFYGWVRQRFDAWPALALTALLALNPLMYRYSGDVLSDVPYWAVSLAAIVALDRWQASGKRRWFALSLLMAACGVWTRQIGVALVLAIWATLAARRRWRALAVALAVLGLASVLWPATEHGYRLTHAMGQSTLNQAGVSQTLTHSPLKLEFIKHFAVQNPVSQDKAGMARDAGQYAAWVGARVAGYGTLMATQFLPPPLNRGALVAAVFWALALVGYWRLRRTLGVLAWYLPLYAMILAVYPYTTPRFLLPVLPFVAALGASALMAGADALRHYGELWQAGPKALARVPQIALLAVFVLALAGGHLPQTIRWVRAGIKVNQANVGPSTRTANRDFYDALRWMNHHTPPDALIISRKPPVTYYYSGRKSTAFPFTAQPTALAHYLDAHALRADPAFSGVYLLEDTAFEETRRSMGPLKAACASRLHPVHAFVSGVRLWQWRLNRPVPQ